MADEARHVFRGDHALLDQLGAADDALQRRFQFMRYVRGKLAAVALGVFLLGDIERQQHRAHSRAVRIDARDIKLIRAPAALAANLAVTVGHGARDRRAHLVAALDSQEIPADAGSVRLQKLLGRKVHAQHAALLIQQHERFAHAAGDLREFVRLLPQRAHLTRNFQMLAVDPVQKRRKLFIRVVIERIFQIERVQRLDDASGKPARKRARENQRHGEYDQNRPQHPQRKHADRIGADGNAQHRAVGQPLRVIKRLFQQRRGIAHVFSLARLHRGFDFRPGGVVFQRFAAGLRVIAHVAVRVHPGQAVAVGMQLFKKRFAFALHRDSGQVQFVLHLIFLHAAEILVQAAHDNPQACNQHGGRHKQDGPENFARHVVSPSSR